MDVLVLALGAEEGMRQCGKEGERAVGRTSGCTDESKMTVTPKASSWQEEEAEPRPKQDDAERIPPFWNGVPTDGTEGAERRAREQWVRVRARRAAEKLYPSKIFLF